MCGSILDDLSFNKGFFVFQVIATLNLAEELKAPKVSAETTFDFEI